MVRYVGASVSTLFSEEGANNLHLANYVANLPPHRVKRSFNILTLTTAQDTTKSNPYDSTTFFDAWANYHSKKNFPLSIAEHRAVSLLASDATSITKLVQSADILYLPGGNTDAALKIWREASILSLLINILSGKVNSNHIIVGSSAGAIFGATQYATDSERFENNATDWSIRVSQGAGILPFGIIPHYQPEDDRTNVVKKDSPDSTQWLGLPENTGFEYVVHGSKTSLIRLIQFTSSKPIHWYSKPTENPQSIEPKQVYTTPTGLTYSVSSWVNPNNIRTLAQKVS